MIRIDATQEFPVVIITAAQGTDAEVDQELGHLADQYQAGDTERASVLAYSLVGDRVKKMLQVAARGWKISEEDLSALAKQAIEISLQNSGVTKLKWTDGVWENFIERCRSGQHPVARMIWKMLPDKLRLELESTKWLKAFPTGNELLKSLNEILKRKDFYDPALFAGVPIPGEAKTLMDKGQNLTFSERTRLNALLLSAGCPEVRAQEKAPAKSPLGYFSRYVLPEMRSKTIPEVAGGKVVAPHLLEALSALKPIWEELRRMEEMGTMPSDLARLPLAERLAEFQRQKFQAMYGADRRTWPKSAQVFGPKVVQRLLEMGMFPEESRHQRPATARPSSPSYSGGDESHAMFLLSGGHQSRVYRVLLDRLYSPDQVEHRVGVFLATHTTDPTPKEIQTFLTTLDEASLDDIQSLGWRNVVTQVDEAVLEAVRSMSDAELAQLTQMEPQTAVMAIRAVVFVRRAAGIKVTTAASHFSDERSSWSLRAAG